MKKTFIGVVGVVVVGLVSILWYRSAFLSHEERTVIHAQVVLTKLKNEGFLVTQTYMFNQKVEIEKSSGSEWKDIFWAQKITATGNMKISSGVDLHQLTEQDIIVTRDKISLSLPPIEEHSSELVGDITLINKQGLLKRVFDNDDGYNLAYTRLKEEAEKAARAPELRQEAEENAKSEIEKLLKLIDGTKEITIKFRSVSSTT